MHDLTLTDQTAGADDDDGLKCLNFLTTDI